MTLDIPSIYFVSIVTNLSMTLAVMIVALRQSIPGLKLLAWGLVANSGYYLVLGAKGILPDLLAIGVGNMLGALTLTLVLRAVLSSRRAKMEPALYITPVAMMFVVSMVLVDDRPSRLTIASFILSYQIGLILWALVRPGNAFVGRGRMIMAIACVAGILTMAYRGFSFLFGWHEVTPFQFRDTLTTVFYMINYLGMFFLAFGFVLSTVEQGAEQNRRMALIDPLTGLFNRRALFEAMEKLFFKAEAEGQPLSLMIMDIDLFKQVNDVYGHQAGDIVLKRVANTINGRLRHGDIVGRIGGEEFLAVLPETPPEGALQLAEELRQTMAAESVIFKEQKIQVTISVGLYSSVSLVSSQTPDSAIASADKALYRAKNNGRNRVEANQVMTAIPA